MQSQLSHRTRKQESAQSRTVGWRHRNSDPPKPSTVLGFRMPCFDIQEKLDVCWRTYLQAIRKCTDILKTIVMLQSRFRLMDNARSRALLISLCVCWISISSWGTTSAKIPVNALLSYDLVQEGGTWSGESVQDINLSMRGRTGLANMLGLNLRITRRGGEWSLLRGIAPSYALNLRGRHYTLSSGYSGSIRRGIVDSRVYENLTVSLSGLPTFKVAYARQGTRDLPEEHKVNATRRDIQLGVEDEIGPFRIRLDRNENTSKDLIRGPEYDVTSVRTSRNLDFRYFYRRLFSLNGRYRAEQFRTERGATGETDEETRDLSLNFRIAPVSSAALSGTITERQQRRGDLGRERRSSLRDMFQLMLQPVQGILIKGIYARNDTPQDEERRSSNETRSLTLDVKPGQYLALSGLFTVLDSREQERTVLTLRRNTFDLLAEPILGLRLSSRVDRSRSTDFVAELDNDRDHAITKLEAILTKNFRTNISYDWQKFLRSWADTTDEETRHRVAIAGAYSFARMLDLRATSSRSVSGESSTALLTCGVDYSRDESRVSLQYNRSRSLSIDPSSSQKREQTTRILKAEANLKISRTNLLYISYESRLGALGGTQRISFRVNIRS